MNACRPCELGEPGNTGFNVSGSHHHQIGQFIDDAHNVGKFAIRDLIQRQFVAGNPDGGDGRSLFRG
ncbi:MAG: hypothetical protein BWY82_01606 [Verrucomicrobia bacterium ADurb.Bin474]|nr:MAG: hypothetical protein BWY82_01606 [Verrucomicrobia bacterium ADurb.Bin474]